MRMFLSVAILLLSGVLDFTSGSTLKPFQDLNTEEALKYLYEKILSLENRGTPDLTQKTRGEIKDELTAKLAEMEVSFVNKHSDLSTKQQELEKNASKQKESLDELSERFRKERDDRLSADDRISTEVHRLQRRALETVQKIDRVEHGVTSVAEGGRNRTGMLEVKINEAKDLAHSCLASLRDIEGAIRMNMSSPVKVLRTLANHASEISSINARLIRVENRCSDPPYVESGHPIDGGFEGRDHQGVVTYACRGDKVPAGNDTLRCIYGKWTGELPRCVDPVCDPPCENGGVCLKNNFCRCSPLFSGDRCQNASDHAQCGLDLRNVGVNGSGAVGGNSSSGAPSWPWMAAVYRKGESVMQCAGSIINRQFVLTSHFCMLNYNDDWKQLDTTDLAVRLGVTDTGDLTHLRECNVRTIYFHPLFNITMYFDYAIVLMELEEPIDYDIFIRPVCLPPRETPEDNPFYEPQSSVHKIVWDKDGENYALREYHHVVQPPDICKRRFPEHFFGRNVPDRKFCAAQSEKAGCPRMDRGSAAVQSRPDGRGGLVWTQVGVGLGCVRYAGGSKYSYFSRLQQLVPWVEETVEGVAGHW